ncbi:MAG: cupin domain-containing protein [Endomicrobiales bacterium]|nr:cupin domain-containing protein [Endomicrobiales bacterium]
MLIKKLAKCGVFTAGDKTRLKEILHPAKQKLKLRYSLAHATLKQGRVSLPHRLKSSEVYYILKGRGRMHINGERKTVVPGDTVYIPPRSVQLIKNLGREDLVFLCVVDPAWKKSDEMILAKKRT